MKTDISEVKTIGSGIMRPEGVMALQYLLRLGGKKDGLYRKP